MNPYHEPEDWRQDAVCASTDPETFFPENDNAKAKAMCHVCPVVDPCLQWATDNREYGIWGGMSETERRNLRRRAARLAA